jgi:DMSO/TMAO reductase YedYZ molybdopterin-dependent catalytic subunit
VTTATLAMGRRTRKPSSLRYYQDGPPAAVDLNTWRLRLTGLGVPDRALSFAELAELPRVLANRRYVCVCNWSIREEWAGYLLEDLLRCCGWDGRVEGRYLRQVSIGTPDKGVYESTIPLGPALARQAMLIDRVGGEPLPLERGYPLRLIDFGLYGYKSVKGLARLEMTDTFELGIWERKAGYALDGEIQPKRYRFCDLGGHHFVTGPGEVTEI